VVHRDLKPENFLLKAKHATVDHPCTQHNVRCIDFGSAALVRPGARPARARDRAPAVPLAAEPVLCLRASRPSAIVPGCVCPTPRSKHVLQRTLPPPPVLGRARTA